MSTRYHDWRKMAWALFLIFGGPAIISSLNPGLLSEKAGAALIAWGIAVGALGYGEGKAEVRSELQPQIDSLLDALKKREMGQNQKF